MVQLQEGRITQEAAARCLEISVRQVGRLFKKFVQEGVAGLISKRREQPSNRKINSTFLQKAMDLIGLHYRDFGPTFATEKLRELHQIKLSVETVRKNMIAHGYWHAKRGQIVRNHPMRERRAQRGELVQIDGSPHDWFEGRSAKCCLLVFIDDATGELMELQFVDTETTLGYMAALQRYIERHGLPVALYSDKHSIFRINAKEADSEAQTQFARALEELSIKGIQAHSPQAKGRVERANQTLQDRLVKEMRLAKIDDQAQANAWLPKFILAFNRRFSVAARSAIDAHKQYENEQVVLSRILSKQKTCTLSKNLSFQFEGQLFQVKTESSGLSLRGAKVRLYLHQNGTKEVLWRKRPLRFEVLDKPQKQAPAVDSKGLNEVVDICIKSRTTKPPAETHPWKNGITKNDQKKTTIKATFANVKINIEIPIAAT